MRVTICAVGRQRQSPELSLVEDYLSRFDKTGRAYGLGPTQIREVEDKKGGGMAAEVELLRRAIPENAYTIVLSERGKTFSSEQFSQKIGNCQFDGCKDLAFVIGGADGLPPQFENEADLKLSFGKMVWPHMLVRVMVAEQLYRAAAIMAGTPYHRA